MLATVIALAYPVGDVAILTIVLLVLASGRPAPVGPAALLVGAGPVRPSP